MPLIKIKIPLGTEVNPKKYQRLIDDIRYAIWTLGEVRADIAIEIEYLPDSAEPEKVDVFVDWVTQRAESDDVKIAAAINRFLAAHGLETHSLTTLRGSKVVYRDGKRIK